jgi:integrase
MAKRRQNGEGSISQRKSGTWQARISYDDPVTGQSKRTSVDAPTAAAVRIKMKEVRERLEAGAPVKDSARTVGDWLNRWCETTLAVSKRKAATKSLYATLAKKHLMAAPFGAITLDKLRPTDIEKLILDLRAKGLSDSTIRSVYTTLKVALDGAVRDKLVSRNEAAQVDRPGVKRIEAKHLDAADVTAVLRAAENSRYHCALVLIAATGLRRGEALALRWDRLNLEAAELKVQDTLGRIGKQLVISEAKTERSRRPVPLSPSLVAMLRKHKAAQNAERLAAGDQWQDNNLVFTTALGHKVEPRNILRIIETAAKTAGIADVGVHILRHSAATLWLENGVPLKVASDLLGHSSVAITADIYMHTSDTTARSAIDGLGASLGL